MVGPKRWKALTQTTEHSRVAAHQNAAKPEPKKDVRLVDFAAPCTVMLGPPRKQGGLSYQSVNSLYSLRSAACHGKHLVTIDALQSEAGASGIADRPWSECHALAMGFLVHLASLCR